MSKRKITLTIDADMMNRIRRIIPLLPASDSDAEDVVTPEDYLLYLLEKDLEFNEADMLVNIYTGEVCFQNDVCNEVDRAIFEVNPLALEEERLREVIEARGRILEKIRQAGWRELADVPAAGE